MQRKTRKDCLSTFFVLAFPQTGSLKGARVHGDGKEMMVFGREPKEENMKKKTQPKGTSQCSLHPLNQLSLPLEKVYYQSPAVSVLEGMCFIKEVVTLNFVFHSIVIMCVVT